ncbi:hypothetical protein [Roseococcus sp. YIM B11640]|uniref:BatD family protein n=1 Tax=Roseococcus sp. YIM B11640 TaxID=3133973 RepID=UPI003C7E55B9
MRRLAFAALLLAATPAFAQDPAPFLLRLSVEPQAPVWVGQRIAVTLTAMTPVRFVTPIAWPDLTAGQGRLIVLPEANTVPGTERVGGQSYAALQHTWSVFAAGAGGLTLAPIRLSASVGGPDGQPMQAEAATEAVRIETRLPPGVTDATRLVVAPRFRMTAAVEGDPAQARVGDAIVRTLHMEADDTSSMLLPPGLWGEPDGVRAYPDPPVLQDHSDRGELRAMRNERVAFVPQRPGAVELPGFAVSWLDPRDGRVQEVRVEPLRLQVRPAAGGGAQASAAAFRWWWIAAAALLLLVLAGGIWMWRHRHRRAPDALSELTAACRANDARRALRALYRWTDALLPPGGARTVEALARHSGVAALAEETDALVLAVPAAAPWNGAGLLAAARQVEGALHRHPRRHAPEALPALNPDAALRPPPRLAQPRWAR